MTQSSASAPNLVFDGTLESFFYEELEGASEREGMALDRELRAYLVHMLASHARRPQIAGRTSPALATQFLAARESGATALREVGDRALYIAGVVPDSLERSPVNVGYVAGIGSAAYREIHARRARLEVFRRLADRFEEIVELLGRMLRGGSGERDLLGLYERWRRRGDPRDARRLVEAGIHIDAHGSDLIQ